MSQRLTATLFILAWIGLSMQPATAATFNVQTAADFQNALTQAQNNGEDDTINLAAGNFSAAATFTYTASSTENHSLVIVGAGSGATSLDGGNANQVLSIDTTGAVTPGDQSAPVTVQNLAISNGSTSNSGAGLSVLTNDASITLDHCVFSKNVSSSGNSGGAGLISFLTGNITVTNSAFTDNSANNIGGLRADSRGGTVTVTANTFTGNQALSSVSGVAGLSVSCRDGNALVSGNILHQNTSAGGAGGGEFDMNGSGSMTLVNNIFSQNIAGAGQNGFGGGGAALANNGTGNLTLTNNTFFGNSTADSGNGAGNGGGIWLKIEDDNAKAFLFNNIAVGNTADGNGDDIYADDDGNSSNHDNVGSPIELFNSDFGVFFSFCLNTPACASNANVTEGSNLAGLDPLFVDAANGDLHLTQNSPCINRGDSAAPSLPATDFEGDPRIIGVAPDIGADEFGTCGDGVVGVGEQCDGTPDCDANCMLIVCGNGILQDGEGCDDGNTVNGDGCDSVCQIESSGAGVGVSGGGCSLQVATPGASTGIFFALCGLAGIWLRRSRKA